MPTPATQPVPEGVHTLTLNLFYNGDCLKAFQFYQNAFGAEPLGEPMLAPDGKSVAHAMMRIGDSNLMMADSWPDSWETGPTAGATAGIYLYVADCDALFQQAVDAGCTIVFPMNDTFWGDRYGKVKDPYGHTWAIATQKWIVSPEEMQAGMEEWMKNMEAPAS
jgi:uncharacterized glyoxalase superfamily protein PhnB